MPTTDLSNARKCVCAVFGRMSIGIDVVNAYSGSCCNETCAQTLVYYYYSVQGNVCVVCVCVCISTSDGYFDAL